MWLGKDTALDPHVYRLDGEALTVCHHETEAGGSHPRPRSCTKPEQPFASSAAAAPSIQCVGDTFLRGPAS